MNMNVRCFISLYVKMRVDISILVMGDASGIIEYDRKTPQLSSAALHITQDTTSTPV